jgi:predicted MFS family arabinose efflux permease
VGWTDNQTIGFFAAAVVLLAFFLWNEARSKHALMPLRIFRIGNVSAANLAQMPMIAAMFAMFFFISLYVQQVLGFSPVKTGLSFLPVPIVIGIVATNMARLVGKIGYKIPLITGALFASVGLFYMSHLTVGGDYWTDVLPGLIIMGMGMGQIFISVTIAATSGVPHHDSGLASGLLNTAQQVGGSLGLAILSGVATAGAKTYITDHAGSLTHASQAAAQVQGFHNALLVGACFPLITAVVAASFVKVYHVDESELPAAL